MRNIILASTLAVAALSGAANASSTVVATGPGTVQLALSAGVQPGKYSTAELLNIIEARKENDAQALNFYLSGANRTEGKAAAESLAQLAAAAGVSGGEYSVAELSQLVEARRENDAQAIAFIVNRAAKPAAAAEVVTPGEAQLAAAIGVDPAQYTLAELVAMQPQSDD